MKLLRQYSRYLLDLIKENREVLGMLILSLTGLVVLTIFVIAPAYTSNENQLYSSKLGINELKRKAGQPIPVTLGTVKKGKVSEYVLGEGVCASLPILVPIIPMAPVIEVYVEEGDQVVKGQLLAKLDDSKAKIKYDSAMLAVSTAKAELERVNLGSAYVLAQERPAVEKIKVTSIKEQYRVISEKYNRFQKAHDKGVISKIRLLEVRSEFTQMGEKLSKANLAMKMAEEGVVQSKKIAINAVNDAKKALAHRRRELDTYHVYAPATGVIDRVLVNAGEYNQDSGKPGFMIASGLWFEAFFDQSDFSKVAVGQKATLSLESYSGRLITATVKQIKPIVSFNSGGPEISRPLRPRGSGSPEWAATFKVKFEMDLENLKVAPGMTGFARIELLKESLYIPRAAVNSISSGKALVYVVDEKERWLAREVIIGSIDDLKVEIRDGLMLAENVMVEGYWGLRKDDRVQVVKK